MAHTGAASGVILGQYLGKPPAAYNTLINFENRSPGFTFRAVDLETIVAQGIFWPPSQINRTKHHSERPRRREKTAKLTLLGRKRASERDENMPQCWCLNRESQDLKGFKTDPVLGLFLPDKCVISLDLLRNTSRDMDLCAHIVKL